MPRSLYARTRPASKTIHIVADRSAQTTLCGIGVGRWMIVDARPDRTSLCGRCRSLERNAGPAPGARPGGSDRSCV